MKERSMQIVFEGQSHQIDANTLINVLINYKTVINEANRELGGGANSIELKVNAIEKGSFIIDVSMVESLKQVFSGENLEYLANLCQIVGGVYGLYRLFKGKLVTKKEEKKAIAINNGNNNVNMACNDIIINVYNQPIVREAISRSIETADSDVNVEGFKLNIGNYNPVVFKRSEFQKYIYDDFDMEKSISDYNEEIVETTLTIIALNFEPKSRWQFLYNGFRITITLKDDALISRINQGERFEIGDTIRVKMKIIKRYNTTFKAYENKYFKIVELLEHIDMTE